MKTVLAQIVPALGDLRRNLECHLDECRRAGKAGADLIVFPELSLTGYSLRDLVADCAVDAERAPEMRRLRDASRRIGIVAGFVEKGPGHLFYNAAACWIAGRLRHVHRKVYLPTYGMFEEGRDFAAGEVFRSFDAPWGRTGLLICEDFWHLSSSWLLAQEGMEVLIVVSNSPAREVDGPDATSGMGSWLRLGQVIAQFLGCSVIYVNRAGHEEGWSFGGASCAVDPMGRIIGQAKPLAADRRTVTISPARLRRARIASPLMRDEKVDLVRRELDRILAARYRQG